MDEKSIYALNWYLTHRLTKNMCFKPSVYRFHYYYSIMNASKGHHIQPKPYLTISQYIQNPLTITYKFSYLQESVHTFYSVGIWHLFYFYHYI